LQSTFNAFDPSNGDLSSDLLAAVVRDLGGPFNVLYSVGSSFEGKSPLERRRAARFLFAAGAHRSGSTLVVGTPRFVAGSLPADSTEAKLRIELFTGAGFLFHPVASAAAEGDVSRTSVLVFMRPPDPAHERHRAAVKKVFAAAQARLDLTAAYRDAGDAASSKVVREWAKTARAVGGDARVVPFQLLLDQTVAGDVGKAVKLQGEKGGTWTAQTHLLR
jgi:hypothetical protein